MDWLHHIAAPACTHPPMLFSLCAGFTPAFLAFAEASDSFLIHFWGKTSRGKTTLAQIAASPWGCAADPNDAPSLTFVRRWNLTGNGLEGLAEAHSDLPLVLDELGSATMGDIRPLVYQLSGGQGKTAMTASREMKEPRVWRTIVISTGELSLHARMADPDGDGVRVQMVKGGLTHRALDVELADIASGAPEVDRERIVSGIKVACARYYGTAGPELIRRMVERFASVTEARAYIKQRMSALTPHLTREALPAETARAVRRFALVAVAGEFAAEVGLIPAKPEAVMDAVRQVVDGWLGASGETDDTRIVEAVRSFILRHEARFQTVSADFAVQNRVGYLDRKDGLWMLTSTGLREAAPGNDVTTIARAIRRAGFLHTTDDHLAHKARLPDGSRPRLYAVKTTIIDGVDAEKVGQHQKSVGPLGPLGPSHIPPLIEPKTQAVPPGPKDGETRYCDTKGMVLAPVAPPAKTQLGPPGTRATQGLAPVAPVAPPKNSVSQLFAGPNDVVEF